MAIEPPTMRLTEKVNVMKKLLLPNMKDLVGLWLTIHLGWVQKMSKDKNIFVRMAFLNIITTKINIFNILNRQNSSSSWRVSPIDTVQDRTRCPSRSPRISLTASHCSSLRIRDKPPFHDTFFLHRVTGACSVSIQVSRLAKWSEVCILYNRYNSLDVSRHPHRLTSRQNLS